MKRSTKRRIVAGIGVAVLIAACTDLNPILFPEEQSVRVAPDSLFLRVGDTVEVHAAVLDGSGAVMSGTLPRWTSTDAGVAAVNDTGIVRALAAGTATLRATWLDKTGETFVLVSGPPASLAAATGGAPQSAAVNDTVAVRPSVRVTDATGHPVRAVGVTFAVTLGGGQVAPSGTVFTGTDGYARVTSWRLGPTAGPNTLTATVSAAGIAGSPVTFSATATSGPPDAAKSTLTANPLTIAPSSGQSVSTIVVTVRDGNGSTIPGATVVLSATGTGNTIVQPTGPTDNVGEARGTISSTVTGQKIVSAVVNGSLAVAQTATVTVAVGVPSTVAVRTQPGDAVSNVTFGTQPVVDIVDGLGTRVPGRTDAVTVTLASGNGTLTGPNNQTGSVTVNAVDGRASFAGLRITGTNSVGDTLGTGPHVLRFSVTGLSSALSATLDVGVSYAYNIVPAFNSGLNGCIACHGFTRANLVSQSSLATGLCLNRFLVIPGDTAASLLYEKVRTPTPSCGTTMPPGTVPVSPFLLRLIGDWIMQGAKP